MYVHALLFGIQESQKWINKSEYDWIDPNRLCFSGLHKPEPTY